MRDLLLAWAHHLLVFGLVGLVAAEAALVRPGLAGAELARLGRLDLAYGIVAGLILAAGFGRVFLGAKGAAFYLENPVFHAKLGAFLAVGLLSVVPTLRVLRWRKVAAAPPPGEVRLVRRFLLAELAVLAAIPLLAAAMARGYGL